MSRWADEVNAHGVAAVAAVLGLTVRDRSRTDTSVSPCPACQAPRRSSRGDPRGPIGLTATGLGWHCHRCQAKGDAVTLAALVVRGAVPGKGDTDWRAVEAYCEARGLCATSLETAPHQRQGAAERGRTQHQMRVTNQPASPPPRRPPGDAVRALWDRCRAVTDDADVCAWLLEGEKRRIDPTLVADRDLTRALPLTGPLPAWCQYRGASWRASSHRVIVPLYGAEGRLESLHARAVAAHTPKDKAASPRDAEVRGLVMADAGGRLLLAGTPPPGAGRVIVAEGVPDFLTWATRYGDAAEDAPAVLGVIAGSWTVEIAAVIPTGWTVIIRTDEDAAGDKYAETIRASLAGRCKCQRLHTRVSQYANTQEASHARR